MTNLETITVVVVSFIAGVLYGLIGSDTTDQKWAVCILSGVIVLVCATVAITLRMVK